MKIKLTALILFININILGVDIVTFNTPGLHNEQHSAYYDLKVLKVENTNLISAPVKRALTKFEQCSECCLSPVNKNPDFFPQFSGDAYIQSNVMEAAKVYIFAAPGMPPVSDLQAIKDKRIGAKRGLLYGQSVSRSGIEFELVSKLEQNIQKALKKRIDYFVAYVPDAYDLFKKLKMKPLAHIINKPISLHEDRIVCKKSPKTLKFIKEFNAKNPK